MSLADTAPGGLRRRAWRRLALTLPPLPTFVFLLTTFLFLSRALLGEGVYGPLDILSLASPWQDATATSPHVVEAVQNDFVQSIPVLEAMARALRGGHWLMWSPYIAGGEPVGAIVTSGFQDPFNLLLTVLPLTWGLGFVMALRLLFCQTFFYLFLRRLDVSGPIATFGAVSYTFCGSQIALLGRVNAYLVLPMVLWATVRVLQRRRSGDVALLGAAAALAWLEGFPAGFANSVAIDVLLALFLALTPAAAVGTWRTRVASGIRGLALVGCGLALAVGVAGYSLLPTEHILQRSGLIQQRLYNSGDHLQSDALMGTFSVGALGTLHNAALLVDTQPGQPGTAGASVEVESGAGMIVSVLALCGALLLIAGRIRLTRAQRGAYLFSLVAIVGTLVLVYFKTPLLGLFYDLPLIGNNPANRLRILADIGFAITACLAVEGWRADRAARRDASVGESGPAGPAPVWLRVSCALALAALGLMIGLVWSDYLGYVEQAAQTSSRHKLELETVAGVVVSLLVVGVVWGSEVRTAWRAWTVAGVGLALALATFATTGYPIRYFIPTVSKQWFFPHTAGHAELASLEQGRYRMLGSGLGTFYSDTSIWYRDLDLRGLSLAPRAFRSLILSALPDAYALDDFKVIYTPPTDPIEWKSPVLDDLAVRYYVGGTNDPPFAHVREERAPTGSRDVSPGHPLAVTMTGRRGLTGVQVPIRLVGGTCEGSRLRVALSTPSGTPLTAALRPAVVALAAGTVPADFLMPSAPLAGQRRMRATVSVIRGTLAGPCVVAVGSRGSRADLAELVRAPGQPPIVSDEQAIFYERPDAHPIAWLTGHWAAEPSSAAALSAAVAPSRTESDPVPVAGAGSPGGAVPGTVGPVRYLANGFDVTAHSPGRELLATGFAASNGSWTATVDGVRQPIAAVDGGLLGTVVGPGTHTVRFRYTPPGLDEGAAVTIVALVILVGLLITDRLDVPPPRRRRGRRRLSSVAGR